MSRTCFFVHQASDFGSGSSQEARTDAEQTPPNFSWDMGMSGPYRS